MPEIGESLVGAYLRLIRDCEIVTYNQRLSRKPGEMGETDVIGLDLDSSTVYLCEVVTHLRGLLYAGGNEGSLRRIGEKLRRAAQYSARAFPTHNRVLMLWAPYVPRGYLTRGLEELREELERAGHDLELRINGEYAACVDELRHLARQDTKNYGEPFFRVLQILEHLRQ